MKASDVLPNTPDVTPAQVLALVTAVVGLFVSFAILDPGTAQTVIAIASIVVPSVWKIADAIIRKGRASAIAALALTDLQALADAIAQQRVADPPVAARRR